MTAQRARPTRSSARWTCLKRDRSFTQVNQRHACGTGDGGDVLRERPESVVRTYAAVEAFVKSLGEIEIVARERYVLFRSGRSTARRLPTPARALRPRRGHGPRGSSRRPFLYQNTPAGRSCAVFFGGRARPSNTAPMTTSNRAPARDASAG